MREDIACNNHVGLISIHGEPVNPQKLRQQCVAMALHDELPKESEEYEFIALLRSQCMLTACIRGETVRN